MNKKVICLFTIVLAAILTMGVVSAANLENHNFDDYFSMKVPKGMSFEKQDASINDGGFEMDFSSYVSDSLGIFYMDTPVFSEYSQYYFYQMIFEYINPDLTKCYESQEDNLRIIEPMSDDGTHMAIVGTSSNNKTMVVAGQDVNLLKEMGHTIEFN